MTAYTHRDVLEEELRKVLAEHKNKFKVVLEIGAGFHSLANIVKDYNEVEEYVCVDNVSQYNNPNNLVMDAHNLDFLDNQFDLVIMSHTAEHFLNPIRALSECRRVLKEGGMIISITPNACRHQILNGDNDHVFVLNEMQWERLYRNVGFKNIKCYVQTHWKGELIPIEQDYNVFSIATK